ncbi:MAG: deoxyribonuclease V [Candidatus Eisenbacteria bacterium]
MRPRTSHPWDITPREAFALQRELAARVREIPLPWDRVRRVAGCDVAGDRDSVHAVVVLLDLRSRRVIEQVEASLPGGFPYIPGLLSFREIPVLLEAFAKLSGTPDAVLCDGQGRAHPRRFGLASHLGVLLDVPSVGVAKSRLIGEAREPGARRGCSTRLLDQGEVIGRLLRSRDATRPLYVSVGHRITLDDAVRLVLRMGGGYRLPEPTRQADRIVRALARGVRAATREAAEARRAAAGASSASSASSAAAEARRAAARRPIG